jgi:hypothetical protein
MFTTDDIPVLAELIRDNLSDDLLKKEYRDRPRKNRFVGHCYVASECLWQLLGGSKQSRYKTMQVNHEGESHWYIQGPDGEVIDLTAEQFRRAVDYTAGKGKGLSTPIPGQPPSRRARVLMDRVIESLQNC